MSRINEIIPQQGFEIVRDVIGAIVKLELEAQKVLASLPEDINVYVGRTTPFDKAENMMINVLTDSANYSAFTEKNAQGRTIYFIDVYVRNKASDDKTGGENSTVLLESYVGKIRYILQDHRYNTLGLDPPRILGTYIESIEFFESKNQQDSSFIKMGRITFSTRINESQGLWTGTLFAESYTSVKIEETEHGYQYVTD